MFWLRNKENSFDCEYTLFILRSGLVAFFMLGNVIRDDTSRHRVKQKLRGNLEIFPLLTDK